MIAGEGDPQDAAQCGFFLRTISDLDDETRTFPLTPADFATFNPNTLTCPIFRRREDAELTRKLYAAAPILRKIVPVDSVADSEPEGEGQSWNVRFSTMFHMTNDSAKFRTHAELDNDGFWLGDGNVFTKGEVRYLPLYEGKMVQMYDHRAASVKINAANQFRAAQEDPTTLAQHADPDFSPLPQYWVDEEEVLLSVSNVPSVLLSAYRLRDPRAIRQALMLWLAGWKANTNEEDFAVKLIQDAFSVQGATSQFLHYENAKRIEREYPWSLKNQAVMAELPLETGDKEQEKQGWLTIAKAIIEASKPDYLIGYKDVTAPTNIRSVIPSSIPLSGVGNTFCLVQVPPQYPAYCLQANLSAFVLDYVARQKIGGQHLNFFIVEQFPVIPPHRYTTDFNGILPADFIRERVLELVYTARDMTPFARSLDYDGDPFPWDEDRRLHLRCQLDALYFLLYGLDAADTTAILDTFPIVRRLDESRFDGDYRTKTLILGYRKAYSAGNWDAKVRR